MILCASCQTSSKLKVALSVHTTADCVKFRHNGIYERDVLRKNAKNCLEEQSSSLSVQILSLPSTELIFWRSVNRHSQLSTFQRLDIIETGSHEIGVIVA